MAMIDVGSFGIPANFATPYYTPTTQSYDMPGLRKYLRGQLPADRWSFTDEQLDKLISGEGLPGPIDMYDLQAGQQGSTGLPGPAGKLAVEDVTPEELAATTPEGGTVVEEPAEESPSYFNVGDDVEITTSTDDPPPPPPAEVDTTQVDLVGAEDQRDLSQAYYDPNTGGIRGTFYGPYGTQIDPATGEIVEGTSYTLPLFDPGQVYAPRTGPGGEALGSYQDIFPIYLYGSAPSDALVELDRIGLGLDFVRANPTLLSQWWADVFKPVYGRFARAGTGYTEDPEPESSAWNPANIIRYLANPLELLYGVGGAGPVGSAVYEQGRSALGMDPSEMRLDLPMVSDSLLGQLFGDSGLTIAPGTSQAVLNALGNIDIPAEAFAPENREATIEYLSKFFGEGSIPIGSEAFTPANVETTRGLLADALGDILVGADQFAPEPGTVEKLLGDIGVIEVGTGQFKPAPGALEALQAYFPNVQISPESFSPENIEETKNLLRNELGKIFVGPGQFELGEGYYAATGPYNVEDKLLGDLGIIQVGPGQFTVDDPAAVVAALEKLIPSIQIGPESFAPANVANTVDRLKDLIPDVMIDPSKFTPTNITDTVNKLIDDLGEIQVGPERFALGEGYSPELGAYTVEDYLLNKLGIIGVGPGQFDVNDPSAVVEALRTLIPSIQIGPEAFSPANIPGTVERLRDLIPDVTIDPSKFSAADIDQTIENLVGELGTIEVSPEQFALGTMEDPTPGAVGPLDVAGKLVRDLGVIEISPGQFQIEDRNKAIEGLITGLGFIKVGPDRFQLGEGQQGLTPQQKLLQDLDIIKVGPEGFEPTDTAEIKLELLNDIGMITVGVGQEGGYDAYWKAIDAGATPEEAQRVFDEGTPGFVLDPAAATILRDQLVQSIAPITAADIERDPGAIASVIREDIVSKIDAINRGDIGLSDQDIANLLDPFRKEVEALPGAVTESAITPIQDLLEQLQTEAGQLPETFRTDVETPISSMIQGLTDRLQDIEQFQVPDTFLQAGTEKAGGLLDLLYGTGIGTGREGLGIQGFQIPQSIDQLETRLGSFQDQDSLMGKVGALQSALQGLDLDALTPPEGLSQLVADVGQLGVDLPGTTAELGAFQTALGAFSPEDQAIMGMLLNMLGPEGIASLSTSELTGLIDRFKTMQGTALTDALSGYWAEPDVSEPWLKALQRGVIDSFGPIPEMEWEGLIPGLIQGISDEYEPTFKRTVSNVEEIRRILEAGDEAGDAVTGDGDMAAGAGAAGAGGTSPGWLGTLENALRPKIEGLPDLTADYLAGEPVTASLLADLQDKQSTQNQELLEQLQRYGVMTSGATADAIPELQSLQRRERLGVLGDAATRIGQEREAALQQGLDLGKVGTTRELGLGELTGLVGGQQTLASRQADLDIIAAVIAALDTDFDFKGDKDALAAQLLDLMTNVPGGRDADWVAEFKNLVMGG